MILMVHFSSSCYTNSSQGPVEQMPCKSPDKCSGYDTKPSDGETSVMELWEMWSTPLLHLLPGSLWPGMLGSHLWVK